MYVFAPIISLQIFVALHQINTVSFLPDAARCRGLAYVEALCIFCPYPEPLSGPVINVIWVFSNAAVQAHLGRLTLKKLVPPIDAGQVVGRAGILTVDFEADNINRNWAEIIKDLSVEGPILLTISHTWSSIWIAIDSYFSKIADSVLCSAGIKTDWGHAQREKKRQAHQIILHFV